MRIVLALVVLLLWSQTGYSQDSTNIPRQALKFSPLNLIGRFPTIDFSFEQHLYKEFTVQLGYGYVVNNNTWVDDQDFSNPGGYKLRLEVRYYFLTPSPRFHMYGAVEGVSNRLTYERTITTRECFDPDCFFTFTRTANYPIKLNETGVNFKVGFIAYASRNFFFDINGGFRLRFLDYDMSQLPEAAAGPPLGGIEEDTTLLDLFDEDDRTELRFIIGVRIGYRFR